MAIIAKKGLLLLAHSIKCKMKCITNVGQLVRYLGIKRLFLDISRADSIIIIVKDLQLEL